LKDPILLSRDQIKPATKIITEAFFNDPLMLYLFPKKKERIDKLSSMMELLVQIGVKYGLVHATSSNIEGIAIWFPPKNSKITSWMGFLCGGFRYYFKIGRKAIKRQNKFYKLIRLKHKKLIPSPHWYLSIIGVKPEQQGNGFSRFLVDSMFRSIDKHRLPCFLDTNNEDNLPIYKRLGFNILQEFEIPDTNLVNWVMIRENE
jgi:ribosomal protein S18 acetylase RimI-like enzyme